MEKRYVTLTEEELAELELAYRTDKRAYIRNRCRAIILSSKGYDIDSLVEIFGVYRQSIYRWFNGYQANGLAGLENRGKGGRKPKLAIDNEQTVKLVKKKVAKSPQNLNKVISQLEKELNVKLSKRTLIRFLKRLV